jgi:hypothetical protein
MQSDFVEFVGTAFQIFRVGEGRCALPRISIIENSHIGLRAVSMFGSTGYPVTAFTKTTGAITN